MKKMIAFSLVIISLLYLAPLSPAAAQVKDGYTLVPVLFSSAGVDVSSPFILTTPDDASLENISRSFSIDGQPAPAVTQEGAREFMIAPSMTLAQNTLYIFRLAREGRDDITWAFQTATRFQITSCFPYNQSTNVPVNTGIEITFSSGGYSPLDEYFSISPSVDGRFEYHKETAVFVPRALAYRTVYTVTVSSGITLEGSNETLPADYVFSFETESEPAYTPPTRPEYLYFYNNYVELPGIDAPRVAYSVYYQRGSSRPAPEINVYKFRTNEQAADAVRKISGIPGWSRYAGEDNLIATAALTRVMTFSAETGTENSYYETLELPDRLSQGFYLIDASVGGSRSQMIIQINDLPVQVIADDEKTIVWVNDIITGGASARATVYDVNGGRSYTTDSNGIAVIDRALEPDSSEQLNISSANGKTCVWLYTRYYIWGGRYYGSSSNEAYWTTLHLDRTLFKRDDNVSFFGFVSDRGNSGELENVTAVLTQAYGYGRYGARDILHRQVVHVENNAYSDEMRLPNLDAGYYSLTIYHGDAILGSTVFSVSDYVKPPYEIAAFADRAAVFAGDTVTFTARAGFFEGTPVADLELTYRLYSYGLTTSGSGTLRTNLDGEAEVSETIVPAESAQGETTLSFMVEATLPEIGETVRYASTRAFINDIVVRPQASRAGQNASLTVSVNSITLDRLNNGTAESYYDYLDAPVAGRAVSVEVYRVYFTKVESGTYYDYIEKRVVPRYSYVRNEEVISRFSITTDASGAASRNFSVPDREYESYFARLNCTDGNGRVIAQSVYIGRDYSDYYRNANSFSYYLDTDKDLYDVGERVSLTLRRGSDAVNGGNFLFLAMQRGIQSYQAGENPYSFTFSREHIPNVTVYCYYFNGYNYQSGYSMTKNIRFDYSVNNLTLTTATDKASYRPGDMCTVTITATDADGAPKEAVVNISVVDEALFALRDYRVDTLASLYRNLGTGFRLAYATHGTYSAPDDDEREESMGGGNDDAAMAPMSPNAEAEADGAYLRELFKDTAFFGTARTNELGEAAYTFRLPDNITSWRLTAAGVSNDLFAGNCVSNIIVTNPMFLSYSLGNVFLVGDIPTVGVNVYGSSLTGAEPVTFEVWDENTPDEKYTASGASFERVNIPLWELTNEGDGALIIRASVGNGAADAVRHQYSVLGTNREISDASYYEVTTDTVFSVGRGGLTSITFTDRGRGQYLYQLLCMRHVHGDRIEKLAARRAADSLVSEYFPDIDLPSVDGGFDATRYQRADGGIAILPHADSDPVTTVKLMRYIMDDVDVNALKNYLYGVFESENAGNKMCALYGLAMLREPVLLALDNYAMLDELAVKDAVYIALGYLALGETDTASALYDSRVAPYLQQITPYYRVNTGVDNDDILEATSAACVLATALGKPEKEGLYQYCINNFTTDALITLERLSHIEHEIAGRSGTAAGITYTLFGQRFTRELSNGGAYTLRIPVANMSEFELLEVTGEVGAVSVYSRPLTDTGELDEDITVRRRYYVVGGDENSTYAFEQGDLIRVQVWIDYSAKALSGSYCVTDYLPAGLEYVGNSARISGASGFGYGFYRYCAVEGRRVTFYDYNGMFNRGYLYYYYARVISPGTFTAEGPLVQNLNAGEYYTIGEDAVVVIR